VERYRLLDYETTIKAIEWAAKEHFQNDTPYNGFAVDPKYKGKGLQIQLTVVDEGAFTMPWSATVTFRRGLEESQERVCAENVRGSGSAWVSRVPRAGKPDF
jgi:hypothetical protein